MLEPTELRALDARPTEFDFEGFFRAEYPRLARACYLLTGEAAEAEDLAQEAMARTFERWNRIRAMDSPAGYVVYPDGELERCPGGADETPTLRDLPGRAGRSRWYRSFFRPEPHIAPPKRVTSQGQSLSPQARTHLTCRP